LATIYAHRFRRHSLASLLVLGLALTGRFLRLVFPSIQILPGLQYVQTAIEANAIVAGDDPAAVRALPFLRLSLKKSTGTTFPEEFKILEHTHMVIFSIAFINAGQIPAGEISTLVAVFHPVADEQFAPLFKEGAFLISRSAASTVRYSDTPSFSIMFEGKVRNAYPAVHTTWGNQFLVHGFLTRY
jgi:hypothetical protein